MDQATFDSGVTQTNTVEVDSNETAPVEDDADTSLDLMPGMSVTKTANPVSLTAPGTISYTIVVENTGTVSLTGIVPDDTLPDGSTGTLVGPSGDAGTAGAGDGVEVAPMLAGSGSCGRCAVAA